MMFKHGRLVALPLLLPFSIKDPSVPMSPPPKEIRALRKKCMECLQSLCQFHEPGRRKRGDNEGSPW